MSIIGSCPRSFCRMLIHLWPCFGIGAEYPGNSFPTYSSMAASVQRLQLVHSATSIIMFHLFIVCLASFQNPAARPRRALTRSEEHTSELQSQSNIVCRLLLEK